MTRCRFIATKGVKTRLLIIKPDCNCPPLTAHAQWSREEGVCSRCSIRELQNYHWQPKRNFSPGKVKSSRGLGQNIVPVFQLKISERKATRLPGQTRRRSVVFWRGAVRGPSSSRRVWSTFEDGRKVGDESWAVKRSENLLCSPSSSSFNCYCRLKKSLKSLKLGLGRVESGRKVLSWSEHGTTRPARGAESRDPMSSGKRNIVLFSPSVAFRAAGSELLTPGEQLCDISLLKMSAGGRLPVPLTEGTLGSTLSDCRGCFSASNKNVERW